MFAGLHRSTVCLSGAGSSFGWRPVARRRSTGESHEGGFARRSYLGFLIQKMGQLLIHLAICASATFITIILTRSLLTSILYALPNSPLESLQYGVFSLSWYKHGKPLVLLRINGVGTAVTVSKSLVGVNLKAKG